MRHTLALLALSAGTARASCNSGFPGAGASEAEIAEYKADFECGAPECYPDALRPVPTTCCCMRKVGKGEAGIMGIMTMPAEDAEKRAPSPPPGLPKGWHRGPTGEYVCGARTACPKEGHMCCAWNNLDGKAATEGVCGEVCSMNQVEIKYEGAGPSPSSPPPSPPARPAPPPVPPEIAISPDVIHAGVSTTLSVGGPGITDGAWLVFLPAGDSSCAGAAAAHVPAGGRLAGGKVVVRLEHAALYKLCVSTSGREPWLDAQFVASSGVALSVVAFISANGVSVSPVAVRAGVATELRLVDRAQQLGNAAWVVFLPAGDDTCAGAAGAYVRPSGGKSAGGKVTVRLENAGLYKLCFSRQRRPSLDTDFILASGATLAVRSPTPTPLDAAGVAVLHGWTGEQLACLRPDDNTTTTAVYDAASGAAKTIAVQCCRAPSTGLLFDTLPSDNKHCMRTVGGSCVGGTPPTASTYLGAIRRCRELSTASQPLALCDRACGGQGCNYNAFPVFSSQRCHLPAQS